MDGKHAECRSFGVNGLAPFKHWVAASLMALGLALLAPLPMLAGTDVWTNLQLNGTYIYCLVIDPTSPSTIYAGTTGVYKSTDAGASWSAGNNTLGGYNVVALVIDPNNTDNVYAGTGWGIFKSSDAGTSWVGSICTLNADCLAIDANTSTTLYAGTPGSGVYKSTDAGANWSPVNNGISVPSIYVYALAIDPHNSDTLYVGVGLGTHDTNGVYKTTDGGASWSPCGLPVTPRVLVVDPNSATTIYAGTDGGLFKSTDSGANWSQLNNGLGSYYNAGLRSFSMPPPHPPYDR